MIYVYIYICVYTDNSVRIPVIILLFLWGQVSATCCVLLQADQPPVLSHGFWLGHWSHCVHGCLSAGRLPCWCHTGQGSSFLIPACLSAVHHVSSVYWQKAQLFKKCKDILSNLLKKERGFCCNLCVCVRSSFIEGIQVAWWKKTKCALQNCAAWLSSFWPEFNELFLSLCLSLSHLFIWIL